MSSRAAFIASAVLIFAVVVSAQGPCIECKDCKGSSSCLGMCKQSCAPPGINIEVCKGYGNKAGADAAAFACDLTKSYCGNPGARSSRSSNPKVSLQQCGNAAFGVCQSVATDRNKSPCGKQFDGAARCNKQQFQEFYNMIVDEQCNQKAAVFDKQPK